jgi:hypothetical protein
MVTLGDGVKDGVCVGVDVGLGVFDGVPLVDGVTLDVTPRLGASQQTADKDDMQLRSLSLGLLLPPITCTQSSAPPLSLGSPPDHLACPAGDSM